MKLNNNIEEVKLFNGSLNSLLGIEGSNSRVYFKNHFNNVEWQGRKPRIKNDYINATLDIGYTILFNFIEILLNIYGFDLHCGVLHKTFYMRKSLVCDLVEPFRVLSDAQVKKSINLGQCKKEDFQIVNHKYCLKWKKNQEYLAFLVHPILDKKIEIFLYIQSYYRAFIRQKEIEKYPIYYVR